MQVATSTGVVVFEPKAKPDPINNTDLITRFRAEGGGIFHVRPEGDRKRGITVAYKDKGSRIEFSTSVQHRADTFSKKIGTKLAIEHFDGGHTVVVPFNRSRGWQSPAQLLKVMLGYFG